jgi:long-chain fatty acid transport protein
MISPRSVYLICLIFLFLSPARVFANGFAVNEQSAKAVGMGGAFAAQADDPSAVYYNPAGIVQLEGIQVSVGVSPIIPKGTFNSATDDTVLNTHVGKSTDVEDNVFFVPNAYITYQFNDQWSLGLGAFSNFGLTTDWPDNWDGRYLTGGTETTLTTLSVNPVVAYRPFKRFSLAAGPVVQYLNIKIENKGLISPSLSDADVKIEGDNWEWGWNVAALFWIMEDLKVGASYRSRIDHSVTGGDFFLTNIPSALGGDVSYGAEADLNLPAVLFLGISYKWNDLTLEFDAQWTEWSTYEKLEVSLSSGSTISKRKDWKDAWAYRFGAQYRLNEWLDLRGGIVYDKTPIPDDTLDVLVPSGDRWLFAFGFGSHYEKWTVDCAYNYVLDEDRTFNNEAGDYGTVSGTPVGRLTGEFSDVQVHVFSLNVSYRF